MKQKNKAIRFCSFLCFLLGGILLFASCEEMEDTDLFCEATFRVEVPEGESVPVKIEINTESSYIRNYSTTENFLNVTPENPFIIKGTSFTMRVLKGYYLAAMMGTAYYANGAKARITYSGVNTGGAPIKHKLMDDCSETTLTFTTN